MEFFTKKKQIENLKTEIANKEEHIRQLREQVDSAHGDSANRMSRIKEFLKQSPYKQLMDILTRHEDIFHDITFAILADEKWDTDNPDFKIWLEKYEHSLVTLRSVCATIRKQQGRRNEQTNISDEYAYKADTSEIPF